MTEHEAKKYLESLGWIVTKPLYDFYPIQSGTFIPLPFESGTSPIYGRGCIGKKYCDNCQKNIYGTCLCATFICPDCCGNLVTTEQ